MSTATKLNLVPIDDYFAGELLSPIKHEFLGGFVYGMADARNAHNVIGTNLIGSLHGRLRGRPCRPFNSDTKIRIRLTTQVRFLLSRCLGRMQAESAVGLLSRRTSGAL